MPQVVIWRQPPLLLVFLENVCGDAEALVLVEKSPEWLKHMQTKLRGAGRTPLHVLPKTKRPRIAAWNAR